MRWNEERMEEAVKGKSDLRIYSSTDRVALDRLSRKVLKESLDERYRPPGAYTGMRFFFFSTHICYKKNQHIKT